jgi:hypothetical protein
VTRAGSCTIQDGFYPLETLENGYYQADKYRKISSTPESIGELNQWREKLISEFSNDTYTHSVENLEYLVLPKRGA